MANGDLKVPNMKFIVFHMNFGKFLNLVRSSEIFQKKNFPDIFFSLQKFKKCFFKTFLADLGQFFNELCLKIQSFQKDGKKFGMAKDGHSKFF